MRKYFTTNRDPYDCPSRGLFAVAAGALPTRLAIVVILRGHTLLNSCQTTYTGIRAGEGVFQRLKRLGFYDGPTEAA